MRNHPPAIRPLLAMLMALACSGCGGDSKTIVALAPGDLDIIIDGLPGTATPQVEVTGSGGFDTTVTSSALLGPLAAGAYTVTSAYVESDGQYYFPAISNGDATVGSGATWTTTVSYRVGTPSVNLRVGGAQLYQSPQRPDNSVPMVANRDALLRVFVFAAGHNTLRPKVRVRLYHGSVLVQSILLSAPSDSVPFPIRGVFDSANIASTWNALIPAARMRPNLSILADLDPAYEVPELDRSDNWWPSNGKPFPVNVVPVPPLHLRFVPVRQSGLTGNVTNANKEQLLDLTRRVHPLASYDIDVRATYTSNAGPLTSDNSNGAWDRILSELAALRRVDGSSRQYFGVVKTGYSGGFTGLGTIGSPVAIGWDDETTAPIVIAHEMGHNFGRHHAPCGNPPDVDWNYPYPDAIIGVWALDLPNMNLMSPGGGAFSVKDIMSYCSPRWASDYTYEGVLRFRGTGVGFTSAEPQQAGAGVLIWGRIRQDEIVLEPAFSVTAPPSLPSQSGLNRVVGTSSSGGTLFDLTFDGDVVADSPSGPEEQFAFVVPLDQAANLSEIRLLSGGRSVTRRLSPALAAPSGPPPLVASRTSGEEAEVRWDPRYPMAMIRDGVTGDVLSFARGGSARVQTRTSRLDVVLSNGIGSLTAVRVPLR